MAANPFDVVSAGRAQPAERRQRNKPRLVANAAGDGGYNTTAVQSGAKATQQAGNAPDAGASYRTNRDYDGVPDNIYVAAGARRPGEEGIVSQNQSREAIRVGTGVKAPQSGSNGFNTTYGEEAYRDHSGAFTDPGRRDSFYDQTAKQLQGPSYSQNAAARAQGFAGAPTETGQFRNQNAGFLQPGQSQAQSFTQQNQQRFAPGQGEAARYWQGVQGQFAGGGAAPRDMSGFYDNAFRKANERIQSSMAASGLLNSSQTADMINEANVNLAAKQAMDEAQYGLQASQDQRSWMQGGANIAQGIDQGDVSRLGLGMQGAGMADSADMARVGLGGQLAGQSDAAQLARQQYATAAAQGADAAQMNRVNTMGNFANAFDQTDMRGAQMDVQSGMLVDQHSRLLGRDYMDDIWRPTEAMLNAYDGTVTNANQDYSMYLEGESSANTGGQTTLATGARDARNENAASDAATIEGVTSIGGAVAGGVGGGAGGAAAPQGGGGLYYGGDATPAQDQAVFDDMAYGDESGYG